MFGHHSCRSLILIFDFSMDKGRARRTKSIYDKRIGVCATKTHAVRARTTRALPAHGNARHLYWRSRMTLVKKHTLTIESRDEATRNRETRKETERIERKMTRYRQRALLPERSPRYWAPRTPVAAKATVAPPRGQPPPYSSAYSKSTPERSHK